jgi:hypothetical protein
MASRAVISRRILTTMAMILVCAASYALLPINAASATSSHNYSKLWVFKTSGLGVCIDFEVSGTITYDKSTALARGIREYSWTSVTLQKPFLQATVYALQNGACSTTEVKHLIELDMMQAWTGYDCTFNPQISVNAPWGISLGFWPVCGSRDRASYSHPYPWQAAIYQQFNSNNQVSLGEFHTFDSSARPCYGVYMAATGYVVRNSKATSDTATSGSYSVCL